MPQVGKRYLLFLRYNQSAEDFHIVTGYQLEGQHTYMLDELDYAHTDRRHETLLHPLREHGDDEERFLSRARAFDISGTGHPIQMGWTAAYANNAFLCLPDSDGSCDDGTDLFGNFTPQPPSDNPNGFAALAVYDDPKNGGNGDGIIDSRDAIFSLLRLWIDANHDGISQPGELSTLPSLGVYSISLNYKLSERTDRYGNVFRYRSKVNPNDPDASHVGKTAYDVFFVTDCSRREGMCQGSPSTVGAWKSDDFLNIPIILLALRYLVGR
jgi:hypothetical protein